ncbi:MAG TPA: VWA domain-containing protein [Thermoanaerobaculia bacterium]
MRGSFRLGRFCLLLSLALLLFPGFAASGAPEKKSRKEIEREQREAVARLPEKHQRWIQEVDPILTGEEKAAFLALSQDYQRDAFIQRFWAERDAFPRTARNEFREAWEVKVQQARDLFKGDLSDVRARIFLLNGPPAEIVKSDCPLVLWPLEIWFYSRSERTNQELFVAFYQKWGVPPFRLWHPGDGVDVLFSEGAHRAGTPSVGVGAGHHINEIASPVNGCGDHDKALKIVAALGWIGQQGMHWDMLQARFESPPEPPGQEWVASFGSYSTDVPEGAPALPAKLEVGFPGRHMSRTVLQGALTVRSRDAGQARLGDHRSWNFLLTGEVLRGEELFESFRYKFDFPGPDAHAADTALPLLFQRHLRPGEYTLVVKLEDINSGKLFRQELPLGVPSLEGEAPPPAPRTAEERESARLLAEADAAISSGDTTLKLVPPHGELQTGMLRFDTLATGKDVDRVVFALDGKPVLAKRRPPYSVELDLGPVPRTRTLTATAFAADGSELASDELLINAASHRFSVRLVEPRKGKRYESSLLARAEVNVPEGSTLERVELYVNETRAATLYQPPFAQPIVLPRDQPVAYVRAVAFLADGNSTEDLVFVNAPENLEQVDVDLVELYTTVFDRRGRPVSGLEAKDFTVTEGGVRQEVLRFEKVSDLPIHVAVALDASASMTGSLEEAQEAALRFLQGAIRPKDRAAVVVFNDYPVLAVKFTNDLTRLAGGLAGLKAERSTALYDTLVFSLYYFNGLKGQRALLLLSDGKDEGSRFGYEEALDYARRAGVTIYTIGLGKEVEKKKLEKISEETGGRAFFPGDASELAAIYAAIEEELRSQYLIAYQSSNTSGAAFRTVDLKVGRSGLEAKTMRGYYP